MLGEVVVVDSVGEAEQQIAHLASTFGPILVAKRADIASLAEFAQQMGAAGITTNPYSRFSMEELESDMAELEAFANLVPPPTNSYVSPLARLHAPPPPPRTGPTQRQGAQGARRQSEEDDEDDEEIYAANEFSTPRMKPEVAPGAPFPFVGSISTDSTSTQVLDE